MYVATIVIRVNFFCIEENCFSSYVSIAKGKLLYKNKYLFMCVVKVWLLELDH